MPIYDFECDKCGRVEEQIMTIKEHDELGYSCKCGGTMESIVSCGTMYCSNEDAPWVRSVTEVVDKDGDAHDKRFMASGKTRTDLKDWMKSKGLRHMEPGEKPGRPAPVDQARIGKKLWARHVQRNRIEMG